MKTKILDINGKEKSTIDLPKFFSAKIREDIVSKVLEAKRDWQAYGASPVAGKQHSAKGKMVHRRHVWRSGYGRGASRVPRKIFSQKGSQFNWEAAEVPHARGGMRAHPPKAWSMINTNKVNKKELKLALISALSATANSEKIQNRYETLKDIKIEKAPFIVDSKLVSAKAKELAKALKTILGNLYSVAEIKRNVRAGKGKLRGRKYKKTAGLLIVIGKEETLKTKRFDVVNTNEIGVQNLATGGLGRLTVYTEQAIKELEEKLK